ncbi:hypothetical protein MAPG_11895 [Magnaporthiopsis poae ATCC 64411]|uniref:Uncharacterized protein n=1 Tax=Magnaporthiopsis poae (strain ATCC 64411 / 73-15) TaxID=644358 RepID=A0A0C4EGF6_MAGP6|nr:hypothetical protein MAPG_11895 [Magnaporthiopsis poae ATCC 64411]
MHAFSFIIALTAGLVAASPTACSLTGHPLFARALPCTSEWYSTFDKWDRYWLCNVYKIKGQKPLWNCTGVPTNGW